MNTFVDIGINLINKRFAHDKEDVIERAVKNGVNQIVLTGTNLRVTKESVQFAKKYPNNLFATAGIHPHDANTFDGNTINELRRFAQNKEVVAIGECGLDFNRFHSPQDIQEACFIAQLNLARELNMPLFLHERDAHKRFVEIMNEHDDLIQQSVVHCFTGSEEEVKEYVELGFYIGVTGWICDEKRGKDLQKAVKHIPLDKLLIETDAPHLTPKNLKPFPKNGRNEPSFLPHIAKEVAKYMGVSEEEITHRSTENAQRLFKLNR